RYDETQVGLDEVRLGETSVVHEVLELLPVLRAPTVGETLERRRGFDTGLQALCERDLVGGGQQRNPADLAQIQADEVGRLRVLFFEEGLLDASRVEELGLVG